MNTDYARLASALQACVQHAKRLREAMRDLAPHVPAQLADVSHADANLVRTLDQFVYRFSKLQDTAGGQLFPALLAVLGEPIREWSVRDRLNRLEQLRVLPDAAAWDRIRAVRNRLAHEYPDAPERQAAILGLAWDTAPELLALVERVAERARQAIAT